LATVVRYLFLDILYIDYAIFFTLLGVVSSFIGQLVTIKIVHKYQRRSVVLWLMVCFFGIACFLTLGAAINEFVRNIRFNGGWGFRDLCN
jgi:uncharacterized membrane protein YfcA